MDVVKLLPPIDITELSTLPMYNGIKYQVTAAPLFSEYGELGTFKNNSLHFLQFFHYHKLLSPVL
ncbi:hypothetical protein Q428_14185 [Fervidicella metallireducens AeB]|uniref:Uncharacterized protein n=1 Tax=Fervidicella metallireducens AeB TaxID=1403537 RepID=A0A017RR79_9CLOT|nr:hypothetical protein Q428_14185 [Fervidicella metallireducens AeB]